MPDLLDKIKFLVSAVDPLRLPASAAEVAFIGRSNVGKSSLINAITRTDLARVSNTPGRTRTINVFSAGDRWLVDLPGYGFARGPAKDREGWGEMVESYLAGRASLRMIFVLVDAKVGPTRLDKEMLDWLEAKNLPWVVVATKADQVGVTRTEAQKKVVAHAIGLQPDDLIWVSSAKGHGIRELRGRLCAVLQAQET